MGKVRKLSSDVQDYTSFGSLAGLAALSTGGPMLQMGKSWFDMPQKYGFSFFWPRLKQSLDDEEEMNNVFDKVRGFLLRHGETLGSTSRVQILVLIMMLREFITTRPTSDVNWLCATIDAIKPYYQWPRPYSLIARQLLEDLSRECLCPGAALRRRLRLEHPDLNPSVQEAASDTERDPALTIGDLTPGHGMVHVMFDTSSPLATTYRCCFDMPQAPPLPNAKDKAAASALLRSIKESVLLQMLSFEFDLRAEATSSDPLGLGRQSDASVDKWYAMACAAEKKAESLTFGTFGERIAVTKVVREAMLGAVLAEIIPGGAFKPLRCTEGGKACRFRRPSGARIDPELLGGGGGSKGSMKSASTRVVPPPPAVDAGPTPEATPEGFTSAYQFAIPNLDFRFWPTDSNRASSWSSLDKVREDKKEKKGPGGRAYIRKSASALTLGQSIGGFHVVFAAKLAAGGGIMEMASGGGDGFGDPFSDGEMAPKVPILYFPEDVDILEHLAEAAIDGMARTDHMQSQADLRAAAFEDLSDGDTSGAGAAAALVKRAAAEVKPVVKLVVMGDNATVHRFVLAFFAFQRMNPRLHASVRMQVFMVPLQEGRNDLARVIAMHDPWYQRHVYAAFAGGLNLLPRFAPHVAFKSDEAEELGAKDLLPVAKLASLLQDYTRMATQEVPICAFECLCWTDKGPLLPKEGGGGGEGAVAASLTSSMMGASMSRGRVAVPRPKMRQDSTMSVGADGAALDPENPDLVIPFVTSAQVGLMVDLTMFRKSTHDQRLKELGKVDSRETEKFQEANLGRRSVRDLFKDESFPGTLMPYKPKELIVSVGPPTMSDGEDGALGGPGAADEAAVDVNVAPEVPLEGAAAGASAADDSLKPRKYTSLLFTNVAGCVSDEVLAEELETLDEDAAKRLTADPTFGSLPTHRDLKMHVREWGGKVADVLSLRTLRAAAFGRGDPVDTLMGSLKDELRGPESIQKVVGAVVIEAAEDKDKFGIMLDGVVHGPFKRVVLTPMYLGDGEAVAKVPFMTFLPQTV